MEAAFAPFRLTEPDGLRGFLLAQASVVLPIESELHSRGIAALVPDWARRRRSEALVDDLAALDAPPPAGAEVPAMTTAGLQLGALYVLEGSRLGGHVLARQVAAAPVSLPARFFHHSAGPGAWTGLLALIETGPFHYDDLRVGAEVAFRLFHQAAASHVPVRAATHA